MDRLSSIKRLVSETKKCLEAKLVFPALFMAMAIPDACGSDRWPELSGSGQARKRYENWFHEYVDPLLNPISYYFGKNPNITEIDGQNAYLLRCALIHNGEAELGEKADVDDFQIDYSPVVSGGTMYQSGSTLIPDKGKWGNKKYVFVRAYALASSIIEATEIYIRQRSSLGL